MKTGTIHAITAAAIGGFLTLTLVPREQDGMGTQHLELASSQPTQHSRSGDGPNEGETPIQPAAMYPTEQTTIEGDGAWISVEPGSMVSPDRITVQGIDSAMLPPLDPGMVNVTPQSSGYRMLPHGTRFLIPATISLPYDTTLLPRGYSAKDIRTWFFDTNKGSWVVLPLDSIDKGEMMVVSSTPHFTDFINSILKTPETPQTLAFTPTSLKEIESVNPMTGVNLISPPEANNMGTANLSYPIRVPAGRQGMQPQLAITYNSGGGNGWLGMGWNLNIPAVTIDTKWGVPRFDAAEETEVYLVAGEDLWPHARFSPVETRNSTGDKIYRYRVEGSFSKIIRHGNNTKEYWWEVIDRNGTHFYYGRYSTSSQVEPSCMLTNDLTYNLGDISYWALCEVRDINGNYIKYSYDVVKNFGVTGGSVWGQQIYVSSISYTGHGTTDGPYHVDFFRKWDDTLTSGRPDNIINGRNGFKEVTANLLDSVKVYFGSQVVRSYYLNYNSGAYSKMVLCTLVEANDTTVSGQTLDIMNETSCTFDFSTEQIPKGIVLHRFTYFGEPDDDFGSNSTNLNPQDDEVDFTKSGSDYGATALSLVGGYNASPQGELSFGIGPKVTSKLNSLGGSLGFSGSLSETYLLNIDINGDGFTDKVFVNPIDHTAYYRKLTKVNGVLVYGPKTQISGLPFLNMELSGGIDGAIQGHVAAYQCASANADVGEGITYHGVPIYFSDVNADGLPDLMFFGYALINSLNQDGDPEFSLPCSEEIPIAGDTCYSISYVGDVNDSVFLYKLHDSLTNKMLIDHSIVRMWIAPRGGTLTIDAPIRMKPMEDLFSLLFHPDGVTYTIQQNDTELVRDFLECTDTSFQAVSLTEIEVEQGDTFYFRLISGPDRQQDVVEWDPVLYYTNDPMDTVSADADGKRMNIFRSSEDFIVNQPLIRNIMPYDGDIVIKGNIDIPELTDDIEYEIVNVTTNDVLESASIAAGSQFSQGIDLLTSVKEDDEIAIRLMGSSNVDFTGIVCDAYCLFIEANGDSLDTTLVEERMKFILRPEFNMFPHERFQSVSQGINLSSFDQVDPNLNISGSPNGTICLTVKKDQELIAKETYTVLNGYIANYSAITIPSNVTGPVFFDYYADNMDLANSISSSQVSIGGQDYDAGFHSHVPDSMSKFGNLYRGWGQFVYNGDTLNAIQESLLHLLYGINVNAIGTVGYLTLDSTAMTSSITNQVNLDPRYMRFAMMLPDKDEDRWVSPFRSGYLSKDAHSNFIRILGDSQTVYHTAFDQIVPCIDPKGVIRKMQDNPKKAGMSLGLSFETLPGSGAGSGHVNCGVSSALVDFMDMNGDRYPDLLGAENSQFTTNRGGLQRFCIPMFPDSLSNNYDNPLSESSSLGWGAAVSVQGIKIKSSSTTGNTYKRIRSFVAQSGKSGSFDWGTNHGEYCFMDINGDGLPDRVYQDGYVAFNVGYRFTAPEPWKLNRLDASKSENESVSGGHMLDKDENSYSIGANWSTATNTQLVYQQDINGDGLVDIVDATTSPCQIYYNTGSQFLSAVNSNIDAAGISNSNNFGANVSASFGTPIPSPFPALQFKLVFSASLGLGASCTRSNSQFMDIDADGYPDWVSTDQEDDLSVIFNQNAKINLLNTVENNIGSTFAVDYALTENDYDNPNRSWVMSSLKVTDGCPNDGPDTLLTTFEYRNGFYHRGERAFLGFDTVIVKQFDTKSSPTNPPLYRTMTKGFHNRDNLFKGLQKSESLCDSQGRKYVETLYTYVKLEIDSGIFVPENLLNCFDSVYPGMAREDVFHYDTTDTNFKIHTKKTWEYTHFGNVLVYRDYGNESYGEDNVLAKISYVTPDPSNHRLGLVDTLVVEDSVGINLVLKTATYDNSGRLHTLSIHDTPSSSEAVTTFSYNSYGNITGVVMPEDANSQHSSLTIQYDNTVNTYPTRVSNQFNEESSSTYDYRFGLPLTVTDVTGNQMTYTYRFDGKPRQIRGPNDLATTHPSLEFKYWDDDSTTKLTWPGLPWASTTKFNNMDTTLVMAYLFTDAFGRVVQTHESATVDGTDVKLVSGKVCYDAFGRVDSTFLPVIGGSWVYNPTYQSYNDSLQPAISIYDVLDRPTIQVTPDNKTVLYSYGFGTDAFNNEQFRTIVTDPNNRKDTTYTDSRGLKTSIHQPLSTVTKFRYSAVGQLLESTDPDGYATSYLYDMLGRLVQRDHPDAGTTTMEYDLAGNLLTKTDALSQTINYTYDHSRLISIEYPTYAENNVYYEYGASGNGTGRIVKIQDATGGMDLEYGNMGEVIENKHTFAIPSQDYCTFIQQWVYDSWGRVVSTTYPDGEQVDYGYNNSGSLNMMVGQKGNQSFDYITDVRYDKFGKRTMISYGNGTHTQYFYDPLNQHLDSLRSYDDNNVLMQNLHYTYDDASNITDIENTAASLSSDLGGIYENHYTYDDLYRLSESTGSFSPSGMSTLNQSLTMTYSASGRITSKEVTANTLLGGSTGYVNYSNTYTYNTLQPHTFASVGDWDYLWDANGNMQAKVSTSGDNKLRHHCWDEENRLRGVADFVDEVPTDASVYIYDAGGQRAWKYTGEAGQMLINGKDIVNYADLNQQTLYASAYLVADDHGYTKHYYIEGERICSKIGGGFLSGDGFNPVAETPVELIYSSYSTLGEDQFDGMEATLLCLGIEEAGLSIEPQLDGITEWIGIDEDEDQRYFYHSDHLGSSAWITDADGEGYQHFQYLPFGENWVEQRLGTFSTPYQFSGKEKDEETGYNYFGARYYDSDLSVWLSVDPMTDKYPSNSAYAYAICNPIIFKDPDGRLVDDYFDRKGAYLGSDDAPSDNIRIIDRKTWDANKCINDDGRESIDHTIGNENSTAFSRSNMLSWYEMNVYEHYNNTGLELSDGEPGEYGMRFTNKDDYLAYPSPQIKINRSRMIETGHSDHYNEIKNIFVHEKDHYELYEKYGLKGYSQIPKATREYSAIKAQMNDITWNLTSQSFREQSLNYGRYKYNLVFKMDGKPASITSISVISFPETINFK